MNGSKNPNPFLHEATQPNFIPDGPCVKVGLYLRVSTQNQVEKESLSTQESRLRAYCQANGFIVHQIYIDAGVSAKDTDRPELKRLMEDCEKRKIQAVLVTALDRITRSLRDLHKLVDFFSETNIRFISITQNIDSSSAFGRFMRDLLGLIAQLERGVVAERVANDMHHRASLGRWNGGNPSFGYTTYQRVLEQLKEKGFSEQQAKKRAGRLAPEPKKLYIHPEEAEIVRKIFKIFIETNSLRRTAHTLNMLGIKTRNGRTWAVSTIYKILTSPTCLGKISYGKTKTDLETGKLMSVKKDGWKVFNGQHEPIISEKIFQEAQKILISKSRKPKRAGRTYLLSGLLRCGKCGGSMYGCTFEKKSSGKSYSYYKCQDNHTRGTAVCEGLSIPAKDLDDFAVKTLADLSRDTVFLQDKGKMLSILKKELKPDKGRQKLEGLKKAEKDIEAKVETLLEKMESRLIEDSDFKREYDRLKGQLRENRLAQEKLSDSVDYSSAAYKALSASFEEISSFGKNWKFLDDKAKATKISTIVKEIKVYEDRLDIQVFLDAKVEQPSTAV